MNNKAVLAASAAFLAITAHAQKLGAYTGTFEVSGSERDPKVEYKATVKVSLPVSKREARVIEAEFLAGEAPPATVKVTQYDFFSREKSADSGGHFGETRCKLAAPMEVPAMVTGVVFADLAKKNYVMSVVILSTKEVTLDCTPSRGRPYKKKQGISIALGTGAPGMHMESPQPLSDPARLAAKFTMDPSKQSGGAMGPVIQEWDLKLTQ